LSPDIAWPWSVLGLSAPPANTADLRRAYARALKQIDQATDIAGFTALRDAYEVAGQLMHPHAEAPVVATAPPDVPVTAALPASDLSASAIASAPITSPREAEIDAFFHDLTTPSIVSSTGDRIVAALANPLSHDPNVALPLRPLLADMIRAMAQPDDDKGIYLTLGLRPALLALEDRYHWLSDFASFRQDFSQDYLLLEAMLACAGIKLAKPHHPMPSPQPGKTLWLFALVGKTGFWLSYISAIFTLMFALNYAPAGGVQRALSILLTCVIASAPLLAIALITYAGFLSARGSVRAWAERRQDRRALRRKGIKIEGLKLTWGQRFQILRQSHWLLPLLLLLLLSLRAFYSG
jgi:hypothetical protein